MQEPDSLSNAVVFGDIPIDIANNQKISCSYSIANGYNPHRLDKIHLCPLDYTSDLQELNTWDFATYQLTGNQLYPYSGTVEFPCEKYGFLVMDHANATGYVVRYVNKDGVTLGESNAFRIHLEETESATMGISYVFLNEELKLSSSDLLSELTPEPKLELVPETLQEPACILEPEPEPELIAEAEPEPIRELELEPEPIPRIPPRKSNSAASLNLSDPGQSLFPLNMRQNQLEREARGREQVQFLIESQQELRKSSHDLEFRYEAKQLECDELHELATSLELKSQFCERVHKEGFDILSVGLSRLESVLCPDQRIEQDAPELATGLFTNEKDLEAIQRQIDMLVLAATRIVEANKRSECEELREENERLKEEYQSLSAVVKDYEGQLILTNQEQAKNLEKMTQLSEENTFLKSYETPPKSEPSGKQDDTHPFYPAKPRPKHVTSITPPTEKTQSIIHQGKGGAHSFTTVNFLKNCSIYPGHAECPICGERFDGRKDNVERTKHANNCIQKLEKKK